MFTVDLYSHPMTEPTVNFIPRRDLTVVPVAEDKDTLAPHSGRRALRDSTTSLSDENVLVDLLWVAEHDEANVAHVFLRNALDVGRGDCAQLFQKHQRVAPATADQLVLRQLGSLGGIGFLADVVGCEKLRNNGVDVVRADRLALQSADFVEHNAHGLVGVDGRDIQTTGVGALAAQKRVRSVREISLHADFFKHAVPQ